MNMVACLPKQVFISADCARFDEQNSYGIACLFTSEVYDLFCRRDIEPSLFRTQFSYTPADRIDQVMGVVVFSNPAGMIRANPVQQEYTLRVVYKIEQLKLSLRSAIDFRPYQVQEASSKNTLYLRPQMTRICNNKTIIGSCTPAV